MTSQHSVTFAFKLSFHCANAFSKTYFAPSLVVHALNPIPWELTPDGGSWALIWATLMLLVHLDRIQGINIEKNFHDQAEVLSNFLLHHLLPLSFNGFHLHVEHCKVLCGLYRWQWARKSYTRRSIEKIDDNLRNGFTTLSTADVQVDHSNLASDVSSLVDIVYNGYNISYGLN